MKMILCLVVGVAWISTSAFASERFWTAAQGLRYGFYPVRHLRENIPAKEPTLNTLWPVHFESPASTIAQNYTQHQDFGGQYYHGGCDLRAKNGSAVYAPIRGRLEGGYYSYERNPNGAKTKLWRPWDGKPYADLYFELAVIDELGYRYELHHVDPMTLPAATVKMLNDGMNPALPPPVVEAGAEIGRVVRWPDGTYHHVHYNIIASNGLQMNPEFYTVHNAQAPDHVAPTIHGLYGITATNSVVVITEGMNVTGPLRELVVATTDTREQSQYVQMPVQIAAIFGTQNGQPFVSGYDWLKGLIGAVTSKPKWPDIRDTFLPQLRLPNGKTLVNFGNYGKGLFLIRLPVPGQFKGPFAVRIGDSYGNVSGLRATLQ